MEFKENMLSFHPDQGLMYLIQQVTKQPTDEILGFFYDFGKQVFIIGCQNMKGSQGDIRKNIEALYPGTAIPFLINVEGGKQRLYDPNDDDEDKLQYKGTIKATFPTNTVYMNTDKLMDMVMEKTLLGGSSLADFEPPKSRTPKMYKDLIKGILKNAPVLDCGHSRTTGSSEEVVERVDDSLQPGSSN